MRLLNCAQRCANVFAVMQIRAVVTLINAMHLLRHLLDAHPSTSSKRTRNKSSSRCSSSQEWSISTPEVFWPKTRKPAYATVNRGISIRQQGQ